MDKRDHFLYISLFQEEEGGHAHLRNGNMCLCARVNNILGKDTKSLPSLLSTFFLTTLFSETRSHIESEAYCFC